MGVLLAANWPDLMETDLRKVYMNRYQEIPMMVPDLFAVQGSTQAFEKESSVGAVPDHVAFTGRITTVEPIQGYDKTVTFTEYAAQIQIQRRLAADDQQRVINRLPKGLSTSAGRSRDKLGASVFNLAFTFEPTDGDGTELCAADHPSNVSGVATQTNEGTSALNASSVETTRQDMHGFTDDQGNLITNNPDSMLVPIELEQTGWEIINSKGKVDTADNNANFHQGKYKLIVWKRLTDANNWFMIDYDMMKDSLVWWNREPIQFFKDKDSDTMIAKYLSYYRCATSWNDWLWLKGHLVS
jgi:phage major head subunit gpT-like protein